MVVKPHEPVTLKSKELTNFNIEKYLGELCCYNNSLTVHVLFSESTPSESYSAAQFFLSNSILTRAVLYN